MEFNVLSKGVAWLAIGIAILAIGPARAELHWQAAAAKSPQASKTQASQVAERKNADYLLVAESSMVKIMPGLISVSMRGS